jgi:nitronate monooxygenase
VGVDERQSCSTRHRRAPGLVSVSFGDPAPATGRLHARGIAVATQVNTADDARAAQAAGVDLLAQGTEAGGHTGTRATLRCCRRC